MNTVQLATPKVILVGKFALTLPAFITAILGLVLGVAISFTMNLWAGLFIVAAFFLAAYNVNCAVVGKCVAWAWVLTGVYMLYAIPTVLADVMLSATKSKH